MAWVHYVPVKNDQSDLIEKIEWLRSNDEKAREIGKNGRSLFNKLYKYNNIFEDDLSVYVKMASLFKYEPEAPGEEYLSTYALNEKNENDYFDFAHIYDFSEDLEIAKNRLSSFGGLF